MPPSAAWPRPAGRRRGVRARARPPDGSCRRRDPTARPAGSGPRVRRGAWRRVRRAGGTPGAAMPSAVTPASSHGCGRRTLRLPGADQESATGSHRPVPERGARDQPVVRFINICLDKYKMRRLGSLYTAIRIYSRTPRAYRRASMADATIRDAVREKYGAIARTAGASGCCGPSACCGGGDPITSDLYSEAETAGLPADAVAVSLGCGNPTALLALEAGSDRARPRLRRRHRRAAVGDGASGRPARCTAST